MGNKSSVNQYYIGNRGPITNGATQTSTSSVPLDITTNVNPSKFEGNAEDLMTLYEYINMSVSTNAEGYFSNELSFEQFVDALSDLHAMVLINESKSTGDYDENLEQLEIEIMSRGLFKTMFSGVKKLLTGKVSISQPFIKMMNSATTKITAVAKSTLGEGVTVRLLDGMRMAAPSIKRFMDDVYSGYVDTPMSNIPVMPAGKDLSDTLHTSGMLGSGWLPPNYQRNTRQIGANLMRRGRMSRDFQDAYRLYRDILAGNQRVQLDTHTDSYGDRKFDCPAAALMSEQAGVDMKTVGDAIATTISPAMMSEHILLTAKANLAGATASAPGIANIPTDNTVQAIIDEIPRDLIPAAAECVRQDGCRYGITISEGDLSTVEACPNPDVVQELVDYTPLDTAPGVTVRNVRLAKLEFNRHFPEGLHTLEALLANPSDISYRDVPVPLAPILEWDDVINAIENDLGGGTWTATEPTSWPETKPVPSSATGYYSGNPWLSCGVNSVNTASGCTVFKDFPAASPQFKNLINKRMMLAACVLGCNFEIKPIYKDYTIIFELNLSFWELVDSKGGAQPGIFFMNGPTLNAEGAPLERCFIPAIQQGNSMLYSISVATENTMDATLKNLFGATGIFTVGVAWDLGVTPPKKGDNVLWAIEIVNGHASLSKKSITSCMDYWVVNGKPSFDPFVNHIFTVLMIDEITPHPTDVSNYWREIVVPMFLPYLRSIIKMLPSDDVSLAIAGITVNIRNAAVNEKDFLTRDDIIAWLSEVIAEFNSWMLWRGGSPWVKIQAQHIPKIAWCVISLMRAFVPVTIYQEPNASTITSAMINMTKLFNSPTSTLQTSQTNNARIKLLREKVARMNTQMALITQGTTTDKNINAVMIVEANF